MAYFQRYAVYYGHNIGGEPEDPVWIVGRSTDYGDEICVEAGEFLADVRLADATAFARMLEVIYGRQCCHLAKRLVRETGV